MTLDMNDVETLDFGMSRRAFDYTTYTAYTFLAVPETWPASQISDLQALNSWPASYMSRISKLLHKYGHRSLVTHRSQKSWKYMMQAMLPENTGQKTMMQVTDDEKSMEPLEKLVNSVHMGHHCTP